MVLRASKIKRIFFVRFETFESYYFQQKLQINRDQAPKLVRSPSIGRAGLDHFKSLNDLKLHSTIEHAPTECHRRNGSRSDEKISSDMEAKQRADPAQETFA